MIDHAGYLFDSQADVSLDDTEGFAVCSAGLYKLVEVPRFETKRLGGREDWQLLYIANGRARFYLEEGEEEVSRGGAVLYRPRETQHYPYRREDYPEVYWLHFSGREVPRILGELGLLDKKVLQVGVRERYQELFDSIIREMQLKSEGFSWMAAGLAQQLLAHVARGVRRTGLQRDPDGPIRRVIEEMYRSYREDRSMEAYAQKYNMSLCWFIRRFKEYTGVSPHRFVVGIRIGKARELLLNTSMNISEISQLVGYENPLYFSRIFKKTTGLSPRDYRSKMAPGEL